MRSHDLKRWAEGVEGMVEGVVSRAEGVGFEPTEALRPFVARYDPSHVRLPRL
jgi:hypothetical protein